MRIRDVCTIAVLAAAVMAACAAKTIDDSGSFEADVRREGAISRGADDEGGAIGRAAPSGDARSQLGVTDGTQVEGVSRKALDEARAELEARIASKSIAGGAHIVIRNGKTIYFHVAGVDDIDDQTPLEADSIMRIYSMTKPIVSVAAMTLWERGKFKLDDPVAKYIPVFENTSVLVEQGDSYEIVPSERPISVRDVFRSGAPGKLPSQGSHRSGRARLTHPAPRSTGSLHELATDGRFVEAEADSVSKSARTCPTGPACADLCDPATCATCASSPARGC